MRKLWSDLGPVKTKREMLGLSFWMFSLEVRRHQETSQVNALMKVARPLLFCLWCDVLYLPIIQAKWETTTSRLTSLEPSPPNFSLAEKEIVPVPQWIGISNWNPIGNCKHHSRASNSVSDKKIFKTIYYNFANFLHLARVYSCWADGAAQILKFNRLCITVKTEFSANPICNLVLCNCPPVPLSSTTTMYLSNRSTWEWARGENTKKS